MLEEEPGRLVRLLSVLFALLFAVAAVLQFNDPDPVRWAAAYASAACLAAAASLGRTRFWLSALFAAGFAIWSLTLLPNLRVAESAAFTSFRMQSPSHEESREAAGLLLCATYAAWLAAVCYRRERLNVP